MRQTLAEKVWIRRVLVYFNITISIPGGWRMARGRRQVWPHQSPGQLLLGRQEEGHWLLIPELWPTPENVENLSVCIDVDVF
jgi:hypothetical protein